MTERRLVPRYEVSLPILVCVTQTKPPEFYTAHLRDISTAGMYFRLDRSVAPGTPLELTLSLPIEMTRGMKVLVRASGKVVRLEAPEEKCRGSYGVAAVVERYDIIRPRPTSRTAAA